MQRVFKRQKYTKDCQGCHQIRSCSDCQYFKGVLLMERSVIMTHDEWLAFDRLKKELEVGDDGILFASFIDVLTEIFHKTLKRQAE